MKIFSIYVHQHGRTEKEKDKLLDLLLTKVASVSDNELVMVGGDFNEYVE